MTIAVKIAAEGRRRRTDRLPACAAVIERSSLGKVSFGECDVCKQLKAGAQMIPHSVQMLSGFNKKGVLCRAGAARKIHHRYSKRSSEVFIGNRQCLLTKHSIIKTGYHGCFYGNFSHSTAQIYKREFSSA